MNFRVGDYVYAGVDSWCYGVIVEIEDDTAHVEFETCGGGGCLPFGLDELVLANPPKETRISRDIQSLIDYIDQRLDENPYEGSWITDQGERVPADIGYVYDWWRCCMKPELMRKFGGE